LARTTLVRVIQSLEPRRKPARESEYCSRPRCIGANRRLLLFLRLALGCCLGDVLFRLSVERFLAAIATNVICLPLMCHGNCCVAAGDDALGSGRLGRERNAFALMRSLNDSSEAIFGVLANGEPVSKPIRTYELDCELKLFAALELSLRDNFVLVCLPGRVESGWVYLCPASGAR
jgi:hypothetical protein